GPVQAPNLVTSNGPYIVPARGTEYTVEDHHGVASGTEADSGNRIVLNACGYRSVGAGQVHPSEGARAATNRGDSSPVGCAEANRVSGDASRSGSTSDCRCDTSIVQSGASENARGSLI